MKELSMMKAEQVEYLPTQEGRILKQPKAVWAVVFACVISFMGLGLVDPILPAISKELHATPSQVSLLFSSYMFVTGIAMLITGVISSRIGPKWTLLGGLFLIVCFAVLGGLSNTVSQIVWFRGGWGLGNALFIATALAVIVGVSTCGTAKVIILYEAALGLGIAVGPLLGGELGAISWRGPFFGVAILMAIAFIAVAFLLPQVPKPEQTSSIRDPFRALRHRGLMAVAVTALLYNFGFFTLLAYSPFVMHLDIRGLGYVFFGWGVMLAVTSVFVAPKLQQWWGTLFSIILTLVLFACDLFVMGIFADSTPVIIGAVIIGGAFLGINNTLITTAVMKVAPVERSVASAAYSFVRFVGGAIAPWLAGKLAEVYTDHSPFYVGAIAVLLSIVALTLGKRELQRIDES
jgi:predicted MFS family arabinose efflux permease